MSGRVRHAHNNELMLATSAGGRSGGGEAKERRQSETATVEQQQEEIEEVVTCKYGDECDGCSVCDEVGSLAEFVAEDEEVSEHGKQTDEQEDAEAAAIAEIKAQADQPTVQMAGTFVTEEGTRRSTRTRRQPDRYMDENMVELLMEEDGDEYANMSTESSEDTDNDEDDEDFEEEEAKTEAEEAESEESASGSEDEDDNGDDADGEEEK